MNLPKLWRCGVAAAVACVSVISALAASQAAAQDRWVPSTAYVIPKETATEGEGYFAIIEGLNRKLYIGTHANAVNSWLVEFDPAAKAMRIATDAHKAIGVDCKGFAAQSKIHTRNNVGPSGKIYFATKQGYPAAGESRLAYPGGYPMVYDPATDTTKVYPIAVPHQGIISITPDESRNLAYISTCSDERPTESTHFLALDLETGAYTDLIDCRHMYAFIVVDYLGRAYHPILGGDVARYNPDSKKLERLKQSIDGAPPTAESLLAHPESHVVNWDITPDGKTLYALPMATNQLYVYDLTQEGETLQGRSLGTLVPGAASTDCRGMCVGPTGTVWATVTVPVEGYSKNHLVSYRAGDSTPRDHGGVSIRNPDYTDFKDDKGEPLPFHHGLTTLSDGTVTTKYVTMGVCEARDGRVYILTLAPYTVLQIDPADLK
ncbi:MAG: hypothetical protein AB7O62_02630 [Pirellulales bacterium]